MENGSFAFRENPFPLELGPRFYYKEISRESVYRQMTNSLQTGSGILLLVGKDGTGKSSILYEISRELESEVKFVQGGAGLDSFEAVLNSLCEKLNIEFVDKSVLEKIQLLEDYLYDMRNTNPRIALIVDDAHRLQDDVLNNVALLSTPQPDEGASLQIVLSGLPELEVKVKKLGLPDDEEFSVHRYVLENLEASEVGAFIDHHLHFEGGYNDEFFTPAAVSRIADYSEGNPRQIKKICAEALSSVGLGESNISVEVIDRIMTDPARKPSEIENRAVTVNTIIAGVTDSDDTVNRLSDNVPGLTEFPEKNSTYTTADQNQSSSNSSSGRWFVVASIALIIVGVLIMFRHFSNPPDSTDKRSNSNIASESSEIATLPVVGETGNSNQPSPTPEKKTITAQVEKSETKTSLTTAVLANIDRPRSIARTYIANLQKGSTSDSLDRIYNYAGELSKQNKSGDVYLLYFYAAKKGHANAAFRLAQMADPRLFERDSSVLEKPSAIVAKKWYSRALEEGHPKAELHLTKLHNYLREQADGGDSEAQRLLLSF